MTLNEIAKQICNKAGYPYCWEDVADRLKKGYALPFKLMNNNFELTQQVRTGQNRGTYNGFEPKLSSTRNY